MVGQGLPSIQMEDKTPDRPELVRVHEVPHAEACAIPSGLDKLFRYIGILSSDTGNRSLAPAEGADVPLETVEICPYSYTQPS